MVETLGNERESEKLVKFASALGELVSQMFLTISSFPSLALFSRLTPVSASELY